MNAEAKARHLCRVLECQDIGEHVTVLHLEAPQGFEPLSGQWVKVCFERDGQELPRIYSLASAPMERPRIQICARRFQDSEAGPIIEALKPGETLEIEGPNGQFTFEDDPKAPTLLVASSVAIAPLRSHLVQAESKDQLRGTTQLFHGVGPEGVLPFQDEMERLAGRVRGFDFDMRLLSSEMDESSPGSWDDIRHAAFEWAKGVDADSLRVYLAGHGGLLKPLKEQLLGLGVRADFLKTEQFWK